MLKTIPYRQGRLDCLCGVYSVINAVQWAVRPQVSFRRTECRELYSELIQTLEQRGMLVKALSEGLSTGDISRLLWVAREWLESNKGVSLRHRKPFHTDKDASMESVMEHIMHHTAQSNSPVIILTSGRMDHWTVIRSVNDRSLNLLDSEGMGRFRRSKCDTRLTGKPRSTLQIIPTGTFTLTLEH